MLRNVKKGAVNIKGAVGGLLANKETSEEKQERKKLQAAEQEEVQRKAWEAQKAERNRECQRKAVENYISGQQNDVVLDLSRFEGKDLLDYVVELSQLKDDAASDDRSYVALSGSEAELQQSELGETANLQMDLAVSSPQPCLSGPPADLPPPCPFDDVQKEEIVPFIAVVEPPSPPPVLRASSAVDPSKLTSTSNITKKLSKPGSGRSRHRPRSESKNELSSSPEAEIPVLREELETVVLQVQEETLSEQSSNLGLIGGDHALPKRSSFDNPNSHPAVLNVQSPLLRPKKTSGFFSWCCGGDEASSSAEELVHARRYKK
jgi:hypothetical protein